jgi:predicted ATPase
MASRLYYRTAERNTMKLDYVEIDGFKNLHGFKFDFDQEESGLVTVLLGQNGSGKSNFLEAIVIIFRDLYLAEETRFAYKLRYVLDGGATHVSVQNPGLGDQHGHFEFNVKTGNEQFSFSRSRLKTSAGHRWLPPHIFAYYSGPNDRLEEHFRMHERRFYRDLLGGREQPFRPLFYARPVHSQFVLLAFLMGDDPEPSQFLAEKLGIVDFDSALFVMRRPPWAKKNVATAEGDPRFWGARGVVANFLDRLYQHSLAPLRLRGKTEAEGLGRPQSTEFLYLYVPNKAKLRDLASASVSARAFFKELESTYMSDVIQEVRIRVKVRNCDGSLTFRELSEGEQQLLTVVGLLRFTGEADSLFLLDEPDTHLNPAWGMQYLEMLNEIADPGSESQVLLATHDPLVLSSLKSNEVMVMDRNAASGKIEAFRPEVDPQGLGVVGILRSTMFGLRTTLDTATQQKLDRRFELVAKDARRTLKEGEELRELSAELADAGFAHEFRDAMYDRFSKALGRVRDAGRPTLTREEIKELDQEAEHILQQILQEEQQLEGERS